VSLQFVRRPQTDESEEVASKETETSRTGKATPMRAWRFMGNCPEDQQGNGQHIATTG
jgi:hypothetical protein